jgi:hypothetical protein
LWSFLGEDIMAGVTEGQAETKVQVAEGQAEVLAEE